MITYEGELKNGLKNGVWRNYSNKKDVYTTSTFIDGFNQEYNFFEYVIF
jgi:hypothetical protein